LLGDSNIRGYVYKLKHLLKKNYELYSVIKPGATMNQLKETAREEITRLSRNYVILISCGINDYKAYSMSSFG
jgi:hypothetical protein